MTAARFTLALCLALIAFERASASDTIDLSGAWQVRLDAEDVGTEQGWFRGFDGEPIQLPGIVTEAGLGEPLRLEPEPTKEVFKGLHQRFRYVGAAWYTRDVDVPNDWSVGNQVNELATLNFERVIWKATVWVNGVEAGSADSLCTPHRYAVGKLLRPGRNTVVVRVDNRSQVDIGVIGHAYTDWTQTIWNGLIGGLELRREPPVGVASVGVVPQPEGGELPVTVRLRNTTDAEVVKTLRVRLTPVDDSAATVAETSRSVLVAPGGAKVQLGLSIEAAEAWSEFNPTLYRVVCDFADDTASVVTGVRSVETAGRSLLINGRPSFLRGTLECCIFPKTGYPPTTVAGWDKVFATVREYGLNHVRFHSWCPPEAAFASADRHGVYVQAELPNWTFDMGRDETVDAYLRAEGERILREYGHHPSLILVSLGNELDGDFAAMDRMVEHFKQQWPHLLFTSTTYSFSQRGETPGPADDFFITQKSKTGWVRGQGFLNQTRPNTDSDYRAGLESIAVPLISHEVGQYHVYPNLAELPKYDGTLRSLNFETIEIDLAKKGRRDEAPAYTECSGRLAVELYKEDIERALRTRELAGIQLLDLHDFPGQSTATIGVLDAFWDSKGLVTAEEFRRFCGPVTPLVRVKQRVWKSSDVFRADVELANFGEEALSGVTVAWTLAAAGEPPIAKGEFAALDAELGNGRRVGTITAPLEGVDEATRVTLEVTIADTPYRNDWSFWVYPEVLEAPLDAETTLVTSDYGKPLFDALAAGKRVLFLPDRESIASPLDGRFVPVFWSPVHFASQPGSVGALINSGHPALSDFPTDPHSDWQWWELLGKSTAVDATQLGPEFETIVRFIDKLDRNALPAAVWEASVGPGRLLVCTLDIESELSSRIVAAQLRSSLLAYLASDSFDPTQRLSPDQLTRLFQKRAYRVRVARGATHGDYPATNLSDGNNATFWHSDWSDPTSQHPYEIRVELTDERPTLGVEYTPRGDKPTGRVNEYRLEALTAEGQWVEAASGAFDGSAKPQRVEFAEPVDATAIRLVALSAVNNEPHCAIAELRPLLSEGVSEIDELGLIEGFNTGDR